MWTKWLHSPFHLRDPQHSAWGENKNVLCDHKRSQGPQVWALSFPLSHYHFDFFLSTSGQVTLLYGWCKGEVVYT